MLDVEDLPEPPVKAVKPAMNRMRTVIGGEFDHLTVELKMRIGDAIGVAADGRAEESPQADIALEIVMPKHDVVALAMRIGHQQRLQRCAKCDDPRLEAAGCTQHHTLDRAAIRQLAE